LYSSKPIVTNVLRDTPFSLLLSPYADTHFTVPRRVEG